MPKTSKDGHRNDHTDIDHTDIDFALLRYGADVNVSNDEGNTALHFASRHSVPPFIQELLDQVGDVNRQTDERDTDGVNEKGNTPLHEACMSGSTEIVHTLLDAGADFNVTNKENKTPLQLRYGGLEEEYEKNKIVQKNLSAKVQRDSNIVFGARLIFGTQKGGWEHLDGSQDEQARFFENTQPNGFKFGSLSRSVDKLSVDMERMEESARRGNLRMFGIPESAGETNDVCAQKVADILNGLAESPKRWQTDDIVSAHRVGPKRKDNAPRTMLVKFARWKDKMSIIGDRDYRDSLLNNRGVRVANDLTKNQSILIAEARKAGKVGYIKRGRLVFTDIAERTSDERTSDERTSDKARETSTASADRADTPTDQPTDQHVHHSESERSPNRATEMTEGVTPDPRAAERGERDNPKTTSDSAARGAGETPREPSEPDAEAYEDTESDVHLFTEPIARQEVKAGIANLKFGKSAGPDCILGEMLKCAALIVGPGDRIDTLRDIIVKGNTLRLLTARQRNGSKVVLKQATWSL
nr:hypothetical protein BaRGS_031533 [Batillaria attramentaria]